MIQLQKVDAPAVLMAQATVWTREFADRLADRTLPDVYLTRYRHPSVKSAVVQETHGKCAYCESKVTHVHPGDIEHILPKSKFPELVVHWSNLTLVCNECNRRKSDFHDDEERIINPFEEEPQQKLHRPQSLSLASLINQST